MAVVNRINLLRNIGQFDSVSPPPAAALAPLTLIYAENGRGKTTVSNIFRSLATNNPQLILDRHRLGAENTPHVVLVVDGQNIVFENGVWTRDVPAVSVFDDDFVSKNVCSGVEIHPSHRQNLHELILGAQGVQLNDALQEKVAQIERHNVELRGRANAIPEHLRNGLSVEEFCGLNPDPDIENKIDLAGKRISAAKSATKIRDQEQFDQFTPPKFDLAWLESSLSKSLANVEAAATERVQQHFQALGEGAERWVGEGIAFLGESCPFCGLSSWDSRLISEYKVYFSEEYDRLTTTLLEAIDRVEHEHGEPVVAAFERDARKFYQNRDFWAGFFSVPDFDIDTAEMHRAWIDARNAVLNQLKLKSLAPLEPRTLSPETLHLVQRFHDLADAMSAKMAAFENANEEIALIKERIEADDLSALQRDFDSLQATKSRFEDGVRELCQSYLDEKAAKQNTERQRDETRQQLDVYRNQIFPQYEDRINDYLARLNASFRLSRIHSVNRRSGSSTSYAVVINNHTVDIAATEGPSFKNTLSAGDRSTLALAFFFSSLDMEDDLGQRIVVIDDPMTSLDEHRTLRTVREILLLSARVQQVLVLSHSKSFLCRVWESAPMNSRVALRIFREQQGSNVAVWNVHDDCVTAHDKRYELVCSYLAAANADNERLVAQALRPMLEAFIRVAFPSDFPPGSLLGQFAGRCEQRHGQAGELLSPEDTAELRELTAYANRFHHDSNPAWETEHINDAELADMASRIIVFLSRR